MSKPRLIILSDMYGSTHADWMTEYRQILTPYFTILEYDSKTLANISSTEHQEVHQQFVKGGIDVAVQKLNITEPEATYILGFSVGGTIAWKCAHERKDAKLYLISATRLRNEHTKPSAEITLFFGENEQNGPQKEWFEQLEITPIVLVNESHECYKVSKIIESVCKQIINDKGTA